MFTAIIIDDEKNSREFLRKLIERKFSNHLIVVDSVCCISEAVKSIRKYNPEVVFLDIQMPQEDGFQLFKHIEAFNFEVIFTTAYKDYAINAIRYSAFDYLLKPIDFIDLKSCINRLVAKKSLPNNLRIDILLQNLQNGANANIFNKIALPTAYGYEFESINNIVYCQAQSNYASIYTVNNKTILLSKTLKYLEELLPQNNFIRVHKSYLVNLNYVTSYNKATNELTLYNYETIPVSIRKQEALYNVINK